MTQAIRRPLSYVFLCTVPFLAVALTTIRPLRIYGVYQSIGLVVFATACLAVWNVAGNALCAANDTRTRLALAGMLLLAPFAMVALLWVGLGPPWVATATENRMRYMVLLAGAIAVSGAFIVLKDLIYDAGERMYSALGFAVNIFAGAAYLVWLTIHVSFYALLVRDGQVPPTIASLINMTDVLLFLACVLTYCTVAVFALCLGRVGWLRRSAARAYVIANLLAVLFIAIRGLSFPDPLATSTPWYTQPGFIAGIPAVPWIMAALLGAVLLRRAGSETQTTRDASSARLD